ncbi:MAG: FAD-dependent oxidoreductase [Gammaproteobacteria bacterium]|nr:FAD-dependent oxidoreductase [Gammaproteobacteria bacterium]
MEPLVIVGTGLAGYTLARAFRKLDRATPLALVTADDGHFYSKPMLSNALARGKAPAELVTTPGERMAAELDATLVARAPVEAIDTAARRLRTARGEIAYSRLVLALGARPIRPPLAGDGAGEVLTVNSLDDYARYHAVLRGAGHVAIIGPGLIGCEFANDLLASGRRVTVIGPDPRPLGRLLPPAAGEALQAALGAAGVEWRLGTVAERVEREGAGYRVGLADGGTITADRVLSAVGLQPETDLARAAGLAVNRGIRVDAALRTSAPDVYALGDCVEADDQVLPYVQPLMEQAKVLAAVLNGGTERLAYPVMPVVVKTPAHPVVVVPPAPGRAGTWSVEAGPDGVRAEFRGEGVLAGFALTGAATAARQSLVKELAAAPA